MEVRSHNSMPAPRQTYAVHRLTVISILIETMRGGGLIWPLRHCTPPRRQRRGRSQCGVFATLPARDGSPAVRWGEPSCDGRAAGWPWPYHGHTRPPPPLPAPPSLLICCQRLKRRHRPAPSPAPRPAQQSGQGGQGAVTVSVAGRGCSGQPARRLGQPRRRGVAARLQLTRLIGVVEKPSQLSV